MGACWVELDAAISVVDVLARWSSPQQVGSSPSWRSRPRLDSAEGPGFKRVDSQFEMPGEGATGYSLGAERGSRGREDRSGGDPDLEVFRIAIGIPGEESGDHVLPILAVLEKTGEQGWLSV